MTDAKKSETQIRPCDLLAEDAISLNARLKSVTVGTAANDGRGFFALHFEGSSWGIGCSPSWDMASIDRLIKVCGADSLFDCRDRMVRLFKVEGKINAIGHIVEDMAVLDLSQR